MTTTLNELIEKLKSRPQHDEIVRAEVQLTHIKFKLEALVETIDSLEDDWTATGSMAAAGVCHIRGELKAIIGDKEIE